MTIALRVPGTIAAMAALGMLAACATDVAQVAQQPTRGDAFATALHKHYISHAQFEVGQVDWRSVDFFVARARAAAEGKPMAPQNPSERSLKRDVDAIKAAYGQLTAALATAAPQQAPDACARAQTNFEHWMEQAEEGHQDDHIIAERKAYEAAIPDCRARVAAAPPPAPPMAVPGPFMVLFDFDSATLNAAARAEIGRIAAAARSYGPPTIALRGHTDRAGRDAYNEALAKRRVAAVQSALSDAGVRARVSASSFGETRPRVQTADGAREAANRRVEVEFGRK